LSDTAKKETGTWISYASVTSTLALLLSAGTFYWNFFRVDRDLRLAFVTPRHAAAQTFQLGEKFDVPVILLNGGNRAETVLAIRCEVYKVLNGVRTTNGGDMQGPFVLKPGDAIPVSLSLHLDPQASKQQWAGYLAGENSYLRIYVDF
jgi:hypothetical protein